MTALLTKYPIAMALALAAFAFFIALYVWPIYFPPGKPRPLICKSDEKIAITRIEKQVWTGKFYITEYEDKKICVVVDKTKETDK